MGIFGMGSNEYRPAETISTGYARPFTT